MPEDRSYSQNHLWVTMEGENVVRIGITSYFQSQLGRTSYIELPDQNAIVKAGEDLGVLESSKAAVNLTSPVSGTVTRINHDLGKNPGLIDHDPYNAWLVTIQLSQPEELRGLLSAKEYETFIRTA